jgi:hypothetical protein
MIVKLLSGEFILSDRANGGTVVFMRACWIAVLGAVFTAFLRDVLHPDALCAFSVKELRRAVHGSIPVAGAFFAAAYVALYTRFAAQWTYLAGVYNQIMAARLREPEGEEGKITLNRWQAGFVADAVELHLALKPMFAPVVFGMLEKEAVRAAYADANGEAETQALESRLRKVLKISSSATPPAAPPAPPASSAAGTGSS